MNTSLSLFTMLPPFYDNPLYKDFKTYLGRIEKEFSIKIKKYSYKSSAFANDVFIINDKIVFRFPRTERYIDHLKYEIELLNFLKNKVKVNIPYYIYVSKDGDFGGYDIVPGKILTTSLFNYLNKTNKEAVVNQLIEFINVFHKIGLSDLQKYEPTKKEEYIPIEEKIEYELEKKLFPRLSQQEVKIIRAFYKQSQEYLSNIPNGCAIHGDLYAYNVIWDKNKSKLGIIDFSDYIIGDPAKDFEVFYDYGLESVEIAYQKYEGQKDKDFLKRAEIYYQVHSIYTLLSTLLDAHLSFAVAYSSFKQRFNL